MWCKADFGEPSLLSAAITQALLRTGRGQPFKKARRTSPASSAAFFSGTEKGQREK